MTLLAGHLHAASTTTTRVDIGLDYTPTMSIMLAPDTIATLLFGLNFLAPSTSLARSHVVIDDQDHRFPLLGSRT